MTLNPDDYLVPEQALQTEIKIKGSKFICSAAHCVSKEDAETKYADLKKKYYNATHNCFAWRIDEEIWRYSDDGEPTGTAGRPILQTIDSKGIKEILCVVTRYYGGTKLGSGGLIRAYGNSALETLKQLKVKVKTHWVEIDIKFDYTLENLIRKTLADFGGRIYNSDYSDLIKMRLNLPKSKAEDYKSILLEKSNSSIEII